MGNFNQAWPPRRTRGPHRRQALGLIGATAFSARLCGADRDFKRVPAPITAVEFLNDRQLVAASESTLSIVDWPQLRETQRWSSSMDKVFAVKILASREGPGELILAGGTPGEVGRLVALDSQTGELRWEQTLGDDVLRCLATSPDGMLVAAGGHDQRVYVWRRSGRELGNPPQALRDHAGPVTGVIVLPDQLIVSASLDQSLRVWRVGEATPLRSLQQHTGGINALLELPPSPSSLPQCLSVARDKTVRIWQPTIGRLLRLARLPASGNCACLHPESMKAWVGGDDGKLYLVDLTTVQVLQELEVSDGPLFALRREPAGERWVAAGPKGLARAAER